MFSVIANLPLYTYMHLHLSLSLMEKIFIKDFRLRYKLDKDIYLRVVLVHILIFKSFFEGKTKTEIPVL